MPSFPDLMARVLRAADLGEWLPTANTPGTLVYLRELADHGAEAAAFLVTQLHEFRARRFALLGLTMVGHPAAPAAADILEAEIAQVDVAPALYRVAPERAIALGVHRAEATRRAVLSAALEYDHADAAQLLARLLDDPDPGVAAFALGAMWTDTTPPLELLARYHPDLVPVDSVRAYAGEADLVVRAKAIDTLCALRLPEDAASVLEALIAEPALREAHELPFEWLAPLPRAAALVPRLAIAQLLELAQRRRCAGLPPLPEIATMARERFAEHLARLPTPVPAPSVLRVLHGELGAVAAISAELGDRELARFVADHDRLGPRLETAAFAFARFRPWSESLFHDRHALRDEVRSWYRPDDWTLAGADALFLTPAQHEAYRSYAYTLLFERGSAHAALQLAWLDRGFGTPITPERIAWLADLGVRDAALLEQLAVSPPTIPGFRSANQQLAAYADTAWLAGRAIAAGLPALIARTDLAQAHLDRVRRATASAG